MNSNPFFENYPLEMKKEMIERCDRIRKKYEKKQVIDLNKINQEKIKAWKEK